jgi:hypothetical protein
MPPVGIAVTLRSLFAKPVTLRKNSGASEFLSNPIIPGSVQIPNSSLPNLGRRRGKEVRGQRLGRYRQPETQSLVLFCPDP